MADPALERLMIESVAHLPASLLRALTGGGAANPGGRTLDPTFQYLCATWRRPRGIEGTCPLEARRTWERVVRTMSARPLAGVAISNLEIDTAAGSRRARLYRPSQADPKAPLLLFLHDGGGVVGAPEFSDGLLSRLAETARCPILAPAYRLAPEHRFPAGFEDALATYDWAESHAADFGVGRVAVGGQSIGAGLAASLCQTLKAQGRAQPVLQLLICPILDAASDCQSLRTYADAWPLSQASLAWLLSQYLNPQDDPGDPRISPFRAVDVAGLAPALIVTAGFDPVVDQGESYARKLKAAGVPVVYRCYEALPHAFPVFAGVASCAETACREIGGLLRDGLSGGLARACTLHDRTEEARSLVL